MFNFLKPKIVVATHNGSFHADDVFACATLSIWEEKQGKRIKVVRTRDPKIIEEADIVVDVGMVYDPVKNRFDHHQAGGAGSHENGISYASFGLVWKHYGEKITSKEVAEIIEKKMVTPIDAVDNGINITNLDKFGFNEYTMDDVMSTLSGRNSESQIQKEFSYILSFATKIIKSEIKSGEFKVAGKKETEREIEKQNNPEILVLDKYTSWQEAVVSHKNIKLVIYPHRNKKDWSIQVALNDPNDLKSTRARLPESWGGLRDGELAHVSGIKDAGFCTNGGWFATAHSKQGALDMAQKALKMVQ